MFLRVLEMVLPVLILLLLGCWCRFRQIFDHGGLMGLKSVISNIALPVVLFNAFFTAKYSLTVAMLFVAVYIGFCLTMAAGFAGLPRHMENLCPFCCPAPRAVCWDTPFTGC